MMLDLRTKSALLAGAFAVFVGPAHAQAVGEGAATDPAGQQQMPGEAGVTGAQPGQDGAPVPRTAADAGDQPQQQAQPAEPGADPAVIRRIQEALNQAGHDAGAADGIWGPRSRAAMASFQQAQGIEATGLVNLRSLEALGLTDVAADLQGEVGAGQTGTGQADMGAPAPDMTQPAPGVGEALPGAGDPAPGVGTPAPGIAEPAPAPTPDTQPAPGVAQPGVAQPGGEQPGMGQPGVAQPGTANGDAMPGAPGVAQPGQPGAVPPGAGGDIGAVPGDEADQAAQ
jgi:peptidoglycan hydrolase-like protein with peptidoglycan-binding domain